MANKRMAERQCEAEDCGRRHGVRGLQRIRIDYIPKGLNVDYEQEYAVFLRQEVLFEPHDSVEFSKMLWLIGRWSAKSVPQVLAKNRPDAAYAIAITVCHHLPILLEREDLREYIDSHKQRVRRLVVSAFMALHDSVIAWNNEEKRCYTNDFISEQIRYYKTKFSRISASLLKQQIGTPFVGASIPMIRQMGDEEVRAELQVEKDEQLVGKQECQPERDLHSVIPINAEYEQNIFDGKWIGIDGDFLNYQLITETDRIEKLLDDGEQMIAATLAIQLVKSLCIHFVEDEHWCYFDDWYSPDSTIGYLLNHFNAAYDAGKLLPEVAEFLHTAWAEILQFESKSGYGIPSTDLKM